MYPFYDEIIRYLESVEKRSSMMAPVWPENIWKKIRNGI